MPPSTPPTAPLWRVLAERRAVPRLALSLTEAAECLGISQAELRRSVLPELRTMRTRGRVFVPVRELQRWMEDREDASSA